LTIFAPTWGIQSYYKKIRDRYLGGGNDIYACGLWLEPNTNHTTKSPSASICAEEINPLDSAAIASSAQGSRIRARSSSLAPFESRATTPLGDLDPHGLKGYSLAASSSHPNRERAPDGRHGSLSDNYICIFISRRRIP
jgi:hypothetical protein